MPSNVRPKNREVSTGSQATVAHGRRRRKLRDEARRRVHTEDHEPIAHQRHRDRDAVTASGIENRCARRERSSPLSHDRGADLRTLAQPHECRGDGFVAIRRVIVRRLVGIVTMVPRSLHPGRENLTGRQVSPGPIRARPWILHDVRALRRATGTRRDYPRPRDDSHRPPRPRPSPHRRGTRWRVVQAPGLSIPPLAHRLAPLCKRLARRRPPLCKPLAQWPRRGIDRRKPHRPPRAPRRRCPRLPSGREPAPFHLRDAHRGAGPAPRPGACSPEPSPEAHELSEREEPDHGMHQQTNSQLAL